MIKIDAHQHFWKYNPGKHTWINDEMKVLKRDFSPEDLAPVLKENKIAGCIAVQADQSEEETNFLLELANKNDFIFGVVGWIDLRSEDLEDRLDQFSKDDKLKGWRHVVQDEPDVNFILRDDFLRGISALSKYGYTYDILVFPHQLKPALKMVKMFPDQKFIIDHIAKPNIKEGEIEEWKNLIQQFGSLDNIWCKASGLVTEADWNRWSHSELEPYLNVIFDSFNCNRIVFGSDWPVCLLSGTYESVVDIPTVYMDNSDKNAQRKFWGQNAIEFYELTLNN